MRALLAGALTLALGACEDDTVRRISVAVRESAAQPAADRGQTHHAGDGRADDLARRPAGALPADTQGPRAMNEMTGRATPALR
jgi:hypothetical protein